MLLGPLAMGLKTLAMGLKTLAMLLLMSGLAFAGSVEQVQSAESAREREAFERFVEKAGEAAEVKVAPEVPVAAYPEGMFRVETIALEGNTILSAGYLQAVFAKYEHREIGFKEVQELIQVLTNAYIERGYVTTRVYMKEQSMGAGKLVLVVIEGILSRLEILENGQPRRGLNTVLPCAEGKVLQLRDIEQGLDQINRLTSRNATVDIQPGDAYGKSKVVVAVERKKPVGLTLSYDNHGSGSTGQKQVDGTFEWDDLLRCYDRFQVSHRRNREIYGKGKWSRNTSLMGSIPLGYWTLSGSSSYNDYLMTLIGQMQPFETRGDTWTHNLELERVLRRNQRGKTSVGVGLTYRDTRTFTADVFVPTQSQALTIVTTKVSHSDRLFGGIVTGVLRYLQGTSLFGSTKRSDSAANGHVRFSKFELDLGYYKPFALLTENFWWRLTGHGQYSAQSLFPSERMSLGGDGTVRGYSDGPLTGDAGFYVRNELAWQPKINAIGTKKVFGQPELFASFDIGTLKNDTSDASENGTLTGVAVGMRISGNVAFCDLTLAKPLTAPCRVPNKGGILSFRMGVKF